MAAAFLTDAFRALRKAPHAQLFNMVTPAQIHGYLSEKLDCQHLQVDGDGAHFQAVIVSTAFEGKSRVARHQVVYGALGDRMREEIHALSMQTLTPAEWQERHPQHA